MLNDFDLNVGNVFGAMTDGGSDVVWMMQKGLNLQWEWCVAHMTNAATKFAFGIESSKTSRNPELTQLVNDMRKTIRLVKEVEVMGNLFEALCQLKGKGSSVHLLDYQAHRFLGLTRVVERLLVKWSQLEDWFKALETSPSRSKEPFLIDGKKEVLEQLMSLLTPVSAKQIESNRASSASSYYFEPVPSAIGNTGHQTATS